MHIQVSANSREKKILEFKPSHDKEEILLFEVSFETENVEPD